MHRWTYTKLWCQLLALILERIHSLFFLSHANSNKVTRTEKNSKNAMQLSPQKFCLHLEFRWGIAVWLREENNVKFLQGLGHQLISELGVGGFHSWEMLGGGWDATGGVQCGAHKSQEATACLLQLRWSPLSCILAWPPYLEGLGPW